MALVPPPCSSAVADGRTPDSVLGLFCLGLEVGGIECVSWSCSTHIERPPVAWTLQSPSRSQLGLEKAYWEA